MCPLSMGNLAVMSSFVEYNLDSGQYKKYSGTIIKQRFNFRCMFAGQGRA